MIFKRTVISAALLAVTMPHMANAQALKGMRAPANVPPSDYAGVQYVDNKGCIFVRAGRLGAVKWVARVDQSRRHMCSSSYTPTFAEPTVVASKEAAKPAVAENLDRGKVAYKGNVIKPVAAPDTSMVQANEAKPVVAKPKVSNAAIAAKAAAAQAAKEEQAAKAAAQSKVEAKMKADALAKRQAAEKLKSAQMAEALKQVEDAKSEETKVKSQIAQKIAQDKEARIAARNAAKAARATALAEKKAAQAAAKAAAVAARKAKSEKAKTDLAQAKADRLAKKQAAEQARLAETAAKKAKAASKPVKAAKVEAVKPVKKASAQKAQVAKPTAVVFQSGFYVDLGVNLSAERAAKMEQRLLASGYRVKTHIAGNASRVYAGPFRSESNARVAIYQVTNEGYKRAKVIKK